MNFLFVKLLFGFDGFDFSIEFHRVEVVVPVEKEHPRDKYQCRENHDVPVGKDVLEEFLAASDGLVKGTMEGRTVKLPMGICRLLEYGEIGIEY